MTRCPWSKVKAMWVGDGEREFFTTATLVEVGGGGEPVERDWTQILISVTLGSSPMCPD